MIKVLASLVLAKIKSEPALIIGLVVSGIVALAANFNVAIDAAPLGAVLAPLITGVITRFVVVPLSKLAGEDDTTDELPAGEDEPVVDEPVVVEEDVPVVPEEVPVVVDETPAQTTEEPPAPPV